MKIIQSHICCEKWRFVIKLLYAECFFFLLNAQIYNSNIVIPTTSLMHLQVCCTVFTGFILFLSSPGPTSPSLLLLLPFLLLHFLDSKRCYVNKVESDGQCVNSWWSWWFIPWSSHKACLHDDTSGGGGGCGGI